jgi:hypothetical protein
MLLGVPRLKRASIVSVVGLLTGLGFISCGGYKNSSSSSSGSTATGLKFRAFVSQDVEVTSGLARASLIVVDALKDRQAKLITPGTLGASFPPGMMVVSNNRQLTLAVSSTGTSVEIVNNSTESVTGSINLPAPGSTESVVISVDAAVGYAAVPAAPIPLGPPGGIVVLNLTSGGVNGTVPVPGAHYVVQNGEGSKLLVFGDNSNSVTIVSPFNILPGQQDFTCPARLCTVVPGFDRPVFGFFSSDNTQAWILNCGPECGGTQASVQVLDLVNGTAGPPTPIPGGATVGFVKNQTLYVAGTAAVGSGNETCSGGTPVQCGRLTVVDLPSMTVTGVATGLEIPDGYHTHMDMSGNGQLFVGSRNCTNIVPVNPGDPQRGCLAIVNTTSGNVVIPPDNGDVTGLQPITNRTVVYVVEGGELRIYDTTTDKIYTTTSIDVFGHAVDVKLVDF